MEEFYMNEVTHKKKKNQNINIKIIIIITMIFFILGLAFILYKNSLMTYEKFDISMIKEKNTSINAATTEDATYIEQTIYNYANETNNKSKLVIEVTFTDVDNGNFVSSDLIIYENGHYIKEEILVKKSKRSTKYEVGTVDIDFNNFENILYSSQDLITNDNSYDDHGIIFPDGISYYTDIDYNLIPIGMDKYEELKKMILNSNFIIENSTQINS